MNIKRILLTLLLVVLLTMPFAFLSACDQQSGSHGTTPPNNSVPSHLANIPKRVFAINTGREGFTSFVAIWKDFDNATRITQAEFNQMSTTFTDRQIPDYPIRRMYEQRSGQRQAWVNGAINGNINYFGFHRTGLNTFYRVPIIEVQEHFQTVAVNNNSLTITVFGVEPGREDYDYNMEVYTRTFTIGNISENQVTRVYNANGSLRTLTVGEIRIEFFD
ncbi:MAG: hypothetical protein FWE03_06210 [Firmicutes bacterium]|nr:hypothetical protein [Bacillota bacterium]